MFVGYIVLELRSHRDYVAQCVVIYNQQNICLRVHQLTLTDFVSVISGAPPSPRNTVEYSGANYRNHSRPQRERSPRRYFPSYISGRKIGNMKSAGTEPTTHRLLVT